MPRARPVQAHLMSSPDDVEAQFYEALREGDIDKLMAVWHDDDEVFCVHPGGPRVVGPRAIRAAFEAIFANGTIAVRAEKVHRVRSLDASVHSVIEQVTLRAQGQEQSGWVMATNAYIKTAQGWRMVAHHASPGTRDEPVEIVEAPSVLH